MPLAHRLTAFLAVALAATAAILAPPLQTPASAQRSSDFEGLVDLYLAGDEAQALALLASWSKSEVREHVSKLMKAEGQTRRCLRCPGSLAFSNTQVRAALLLHARREIQENLHPPKGEQVIRCDTGLHAQAVAHLSAILLLVDHKASDFLRPFYLAMARQALWSHCLVESRSWAQAGLKLFPKDGPLIMSVGIASETDAFFAPKPAPRTPGLLPSIIRERETEALRLKSILDTARGEYAAAVATAPGLFEARLRLGRVLWRLGQAEAARPHIEAVVSGSTNVDLRYLAHLFLGQIHEDRSQWPEAEQQYRQALDLQPGSQRAAVALSHMRFVQGDTGSARDTLTAYIESVRPGAGVDPWVSYLVIQSPEGEAMLAELGRGLRP